MGDAAIIVAGAAIAAIPTLQNLLTYGRPLFINPTPVFVEPAQRPAIGIALYAIDFPAQMVGARADARHRARRWLRRWQRLPLSCRGSF